jgi:NADH-quinone oxidoreductase subunit L
MKALLDLFPADDFSLLAVVLLMPLLGAFVNGVFGRRLGKPAVRLMALVAVGASFAAAVLSFYAMTAIVDHTTSKAMVEGHEVIRHAHAHVSWTAWEWMRTNSFGGQMVPIDLKFSVDQLSGVMMLVVTGVGFLIHVYAASYMEKDKAYWRFFAYLNLFIFSMLTLILGDNLVVLFVGWEGVGLCSYLLIGFWYGKMANATAGKKAFIMNRIGDFGLIVGMFLLVYYTGHLDFGGIEQNTDKLVTAVAADQVHLWPIGGGTFEDKIIGGLTIPLHYLNPDKPITITAATAVAIALFLGCTGKSAQLPLYTWLPDAMAGPTPVSALIHAATMVTAGVYLVCRMSFVFVMSPAVMTIIAFTGALTALYAATIALVQNDIKKVLAFSTVSQLGFMFLGVGVGAFTAGFFHVFTHAFFKACLFLGAGSVIHAMHARIHDDDRSQDMRNMGGLKKYMPLTYGTFMASTLAIIGLPLTSGWFSKDEILSSALLNKSVHPMAAEVAKKGLAWTPPGWVPWVLWGIGIAAATMTAFYMCRCVFMTFWGEFKGWPVGRPSALSRMSAHDDHDHDEDDDEEHHGHDEDLSQPGRPPLESPRMMTIPLVVLGTAAIVAGLLFNPAAIKIFKHDFDFLPMEHWLDPVFTASERGIASFATDIHRRNELELISLGGAFVAFAAGAYLAYWFYIIKKGKLEHEYMIRGTIAAAAAGGVLLSVIGGIIMAFAGEVLTAKMAVPIAMVLGGGWLAWHLSRIRQVGLDYVYDHSAVLGADALADTAASVDQGIVDFVIARLSSLIVAALGTVLRVVQNGVVHVYAAVMVVGIAALGWFFIAPHADLSVAETTNGDYTLTPAPGVGYSYRWYPVAGGAPQNEKFGAATALPIHLDEGKSQIVRLEVRNAFGRQTYRDVKVERAKAPEQPLKMKVGER